MIFALCAFLLFSVVLPSAADEVSQAYSREIESGSVKVRIFLERTVVKFGEKLQFRLEAVYPEEIELKKAELDSSLEQFLRKDGDIATSTAGGTKKYSMEIEIEPLPVRDEISIKPVKMIFRSNSGGDDIEVLTEEIPIEAEMPTDDFWEQLSVDTALSRNPVSMPGKSSLFLWTAVILLISGLCAAVLFIYRRKKDIQVEVGLSPVERALKALAELESEQLGEKGDFMEFYNRVQYIVRSYIEERFEIMAPERTTEEFLEELRRRADSPVAAYRLQLEKIMRHCDLVRFARYVPGSGEIRETFKACRDFVTETGEQTDLDT